MRLHGVWLRLMGWNKREIDKTIGIKREIERERDILIVNHKLLSSRLFFQYYIWHIYYKCIYSLRTHTHTQTHTDSLIILNPIVFIESIPLICRQNAKIATESVKRKYPEIMKQNFKQSRMLRKSHFRYFLGNWVSTNFTNFHKHCLHLSVFHSLLQAEL